MLLKKIALGGALAASLALAGCNNQQEQQVLTSLQTACVLVPIGTVFTVAFTNSITGLTQYAPVVQAVGTTAANDCNALVTAVQNTINAINSNGGTATVTVTSNSAAASAHMNAAVAKLLAANPHLRVTGSSRTSITFVVAPSLF